MQYKSVLLVDGENLVLRYQAMLGEGRRPSPETIHLPDTFVWHPGVILPFGVRDVIRVAYYTTFVGDGERHNAVMDAISSAMFTTKTISGHAVEGTLVPYVFKKLRNGAKTKSVDINLTIDALRYAYGSGIDQIVLVTGDGDYIPLLREVMARGKMIQVWALSSGLNHEIKYNADDLNLLDDIFFEP